jgi:hypothetical protein
MSVPDIDVWRSAKLLVDCYGDGASLHAVNRCDEVLEAGGRCHVNQEKHMSDQRPVMN